MEISQSKITRWKCPAPPAPTPAPPAPPPAEVISILTFLPPADCRRNRDKSGVIKNQTVTSDTVPNKTPLKGDMIMRIGNYWEKQGLSQVLGPPCDFYPADISDFCCITLIYLPPPCG